MSQISDSKAIYIIVNIFVGLGLLSKPYALAKGGWVSLIGLTIACFIASFTASLLVESFKMCGCKKITYPELGYAAMGSIGKWIIQTIVCVEVLSYIVIILIVFLENLHYLIPFVPYSFLMMGGSMVLFPILIPSKIKNMSFFSILGVFTNLLIFGTVFVLFISHPRVSTEYHFFTDMKGLSISTGIYIISLGGHIAIPTIYRNMKNKEHIHYVLKMSFFLIWMIYIGMAICGYLFFGKDVSVIVTKDIQSHAPSYYFIGMVSLILFKLYLTIPSLLFVLFKPEEHVPVVTLFKSMIFSCLVILAYILHHHLALVEALSGTMCTMNTSMILPIILYVSLRYTRVKNSHLYLPLQNPPEDIVEVVKPFQWYHYIFYTLLLMVNIGLIGLLVYNQLST